MNKETQFTAHHIRFTVETIDPLLLPAFAGPSIRGALFSALRHHFCPAPDHAQTDAEHKTLCPVCWLMATERGGAARGRDVPRPYTIEPPAAKELVTGSLDGDEAKATWYEAGERFTFGLTLYAQAMNLFPYVVLAVPLIGRNGLGVPLAENGRREGDKRRGRFRLVQIEATNPLTGEIMPVLAEGETMVRVPDLPATQGDVRMLAGAMLRGMKERGQIALRFCTPTRIIERERLVKTPRLGALARRLMERLDALRTEYAALPPLAGRERLIELADSVDLVEDRTRWVEVRSGSRRQGRPTWVSGYVGVATYEADVETWHALLPLLLWGQIVHVGKNATKGSGWVQVRGG